MASSTGRHRAASVGTLTMMNSEATSSSDIPPSRRTPGGAGGGGGGGFLSCSANFIRKTATSCLCFLQYFL